MRFDIFTLFPNLFAGTFDESIIQRARASGLVEIEIHDIRASAHDKHHTTDDTPYAGGGGMVMKPEPIFASVEGVYGDALRGAQTIILLTPQGRTFTQTVARELAQQPRIGLICGRYEGVDERVREHLATDEISIGDYVLSGGEIAAMVIVDAVTRLLPGALGDPLAPDKDSHAEGLLEGPHYTRPAEFRGWRVPDVLLSGHHGEVARWRRQESLRRTLARRPDLLRTAALSEEDRRYLQDLGWTGA
ncbi:MAG: tRNA (guanosine(37)-N1)-methyltransferase TrmD [Chloroflexi bacterium]|nr:tRNA (guanosine(37)-N1)-methyltransferase TrmD [Chloroflexota bacterium]